jgi:hypothetical protein
MSKKRKNEAANCGECKWRSGSICRKTKELVGEFDWCAAGRKRQ